MERSLKRGKLAIFCNQSKAWRCQPFNYMLLTLCFAIFASDSLESFYANLKGNKKKGKWKLLALDLWFPGKWIILSILCWNYNEKGRSLRRRLVTAKLFWENCLRKTMGKRTIGKKGKILNIRDTCWSGFKVSKCVVVNKMETQSAMFKVEKL